MSAITTFFADLRNDEDGASFLEYTVLLGIILAVSIAVLTAVGSYAEVIWDVMCSSFAGAAEDASQAGFDAVTDTCTG